MSAVEVNDSISTKWDGSSSEDESALSSADVSNAINNAKK
jgi:hypothetical protein